MLIKILDTTVADKRIVRAGAVEEVSDADGALLIGLGKAVKAEDPEIQADPAPASDAAPESIPAPRRGRPRKAS